MNPLKLNLAKCSSSQKLLIAVISTPNEAYRRTSIRKLWGNPSRYNSSFSTVVFITGKTDDSKVIQEANDYNDVIITDINENYYNLSLKTYAALQYTKEYCPKVECIVKADSDNIIHINDFEYICKQHMRSGEPDVVAGDCTASREVKRDPTSKWYVPEFVYPESLYPQYCSSGAYSFIGKTAWQKVLNETLSSQLFNSSNIRHLSEDVLFTGDFASKAGISRRKLWGFSYTEDPEVDCVEDTTRAYSIHLRDMKRSWDEYKYIKWNFFSLLAKVHKECVIEDFSSSPPKFQLHPGAMDIPSLAYISPSLDRDPQDLQDPLNNLEPMYLINPACPECFTPTGEVDYLALVKVITIHVLFYMGLTGTFLHIAIIIYILNRPVGKMTIPHCLFACGIFFFAISCYLFGGVLTSLYSVPPPNLDYYILATTLATVDIIIQVLWIICMTAMMRKAAKIHHNYLKNIKEKYITV
ncbi:hypothetical protein FO519_006428 [Halicephalobus sp. NKZ332]|nr:hypothetical protein FO519_006428 [Halicephalobus sp. NKZ332]